MNRDIENAKIILRINGLPEETAPLLIKLSESSSKNIDTIVRNVKLLRDIIE